MGGNSNFSDILCFLLVRLFLCYRRELYGFHDVQGFHSSSTVHGFLESWWFRGFLRGRLFFRETEVFVCFYAFDFFGFLWVRDGRFMDFVILGDSIALPRCMGF